MQTPVPGRKGESLGDAHVDFFVERCIEVSCFDIELMDLEVVEGGNTEEGTDGIPMGDGCKCEGEILPRNLREALSDEASLEA